MPTTALLFDIAILVILVLFAAFGAHRGLLLSLFSLVAVVVAFIGASFVADLFAPKAAELLAPPIQSAIESALQEGIDGAHGAGAGTPTTGELNQDDVLAYLRTSALPKAIIGLAEDAVNSGVPEAERQTLPEYLAVSIAKAAVHGLLFLLGFVVILVLWTVLAHALDLVARLPGLSALNKAGGALLGLVKGGIILFLLAWLLNTFWPVIPAETVAGTKLLKFFLTTNPIALFFGLTAALTNPTM